MRAAHLLASLVFVPTLLEGRVAAWDCDANGVDDALEIASDPTRDCNGNGVLDTCDLEPIHGGFLDRGPLAPFREHTSPLLACDLEPDGDIDLVGSAFEARGLFVLRNDGAGSFESIPREAGTVEVLGAGGDLDGDGDIDLMVSRPSLGDVITLFNRGNGTLADGPVAPVENLLDGKAVDLDGDGDDDIVALVKTGVFSSTLAVLTSMGRGAFATPEGLPAPGQPSSPTTADFDNDGLPDLASIIDAESVQLFIHAGNEGFEKGTLVQPHASGYLISLHVADLDLDGDVDLIADSSEGPCVLSNDGGASFTALSCYYLGDGAISSAVGDFDGDGTAEVAALSHDGPRILLNAGNGLLGPLRRAGINRHVFGSLVTADFDLDGALDIAGTPGPTILWNQPMAISLDCNANGRPDECDALLRSPWEVTDPAPCSDCNGNGIADSTDIELGRYDGDRNGVPDECEGRRFLLVTDAPAVVRGEPGERVHVPAAVNLYSFGFEPGDSGAAGWLLHLKASNASIEDVSLEGTVAAPKPDGLRNPSASFLQMGFIRDSGPCKGALRASVVLDLTEPVDLDPAEGPHTLLRLTLGASVPRDGTGFCGLHFLSCDSCSHTVPIPGDGGGGCGGLTPSQVSTRETVFLTTTRDRIVLLARPGFRRGDVNTSGKVDISDPIRLFMSLFLGAETPTCQDGADANDDGLVNITDGIFLLQDLFRGELGTVIPSPGPFACSPDPTEDTLDCRDPGVCP